MASPGDSRTSPATGASDEAPACVRSALATIRKRRDFVAARRARSCATTGLVLNARDRCDGTPLVRLGLTCSRKVGNAVARNRAKRRLREAARIVLPFDGRPGWDYVLIGRREVTATRKFAELVADLRRALLRLHGQSE